MTEYKKGQRVRVELEGEILGLNTHDGCLKIRDDRGYNHYIYPAFVGTNVKIEVMEPANWPPQVGDIWEADGEEYFGRHDDEGENELWLIPARQGPKHYGHYSHTLDDFKALNPFLVRRRDK